MAHILHVCGVLYHMSSAYLWFPVFPRNWKRGLRPDSVQVQSFWWETSSVVLWASRSIPLGPQHQAVLLVTLGLTAQVRDGHQWRFFFLYFFSIF